MHKLGHSGSAVSSKKNILCPGGRGEEGSEVNAGQQEPTETQPKWKLFQEFFYHRIHHK